MRRGLSIYKKNGKDSKNKLFLFAFAAASGILGA